MSIKLIGLILLMSMSAHSGEPEKVKHTPKEACDYMAEVADLGSWTQEFVEQCTVKLTGLTFSELYPVDQLRISQVVDGCFEDSNGDDPEYEKNVKECLFNKLIDLGKGSAD